MHTNNSIKQIISNEIENIIKSENIDRIRFHEFNKQRYNDIIRKFYYTFFDYETYKEISLRYLWLKIRSDVKNEIVRGLNQSDDWCDYLSCIYKYFPEQNKTYYLIFECGLVYEGFISEIELILCNCSCFVGDFYIVSKHFDKAIFHNDDGDCMSVITMTHRSES